LCLPFLAWMAPMAYLYSIFLLSLRSNLVNTCFSLLNLSEAFYVLVLISFIIAVPLPLWMYCQFFSFSTALFWHTFQLPSNVYIFLLVTPDSKKTFILFFSMNSCWTLNFPMLLLPEGIPLAFRNPILVLPPLSYGMICTYLMSSSQYFFSAMLFPIISLNEKRLLF